MAVLAYFVLFLALAGHSSATYCLCKDGLSDSVLQKAIDYACGAGADCNPIAQKGGCYNPNTVKDHCNYAVNSFFQKKGQATGTCDFAGAASPSTSAPQQASSTCVFPSSASTSTTPTGTTPTGTSTGTTPTGTSTSTSTGTTPTGTTTGTTTTPSVFNTPAGGLGPTGSGYDSSEGVAIHTTGSLFFAVALSVSLALLWG